MTDAAPPPFVASEGAAAEAERHATNLELFLDLVFVFAVTQIASMISLHPSAGGTARAFVVALLVWWQWSQLTWAGSASICRAWPARVCWCSR